MKKLRADFSVIERIFVVSLPTSFSILGSWAQNVRDLWDEVHTKRFCPPTKKGIGIQSANASVESTNPAKSTSEDI
jgi:hypothetical protein